VSVAIVVDDEHDLAVACQRLLRLGGWQVTTVGSRGAALDALSAGAPPQLAIVDRTLPDGDGLDVIRAARARGARVIVISGQTSRTNREITLAEGAAGFLGKPFTARQFLDLVRTVAGEPLRA
jgi:two-component system, OmpR family, response regulator